MTNLVRNATLILALLVTWQLVVILLHLPAYILPSPNNVLISLYENAALIVQQSAATLIETSLGLVLGVIFGMMAALCLTVFPPLGRWFWPTLILSQAIPTFAIAPLFVIWLGYGLASKIAITILMIFFPVASAFYDGLRTTPVELLDLAKMMQAKKLYFYFHIKIPFALPALGSGLRIAAVSAPLGAIVGEWVGSSRGLGYLMLYANERMQIDMMFAVLLVIMSLSLSLYFITDRLLKRLIHW